MFIRETHRQGYVAGDYCVSCPRCDWDYLKSEMVVEDATGKEVCPRCKDDAPEVKSISARW